MRFVCALVLALGLFTTAKAAETAYGFSFNDIDGGALNLSDYKGKVLLVVNTATQCGNTHQFGSLQKSWEANRDKGFVVVAVSSNDFGQEPRKGKEIAEFCSVNYSADYPMSDLTHVRGENAHPFYKWAVGALGPKSAPSWNFHKYLIGRDGQLIDYFGTSNDPLEAPLSAAIVKALE